MRILVTGSADGLGKATADELLRCGHEVVVHVRHHRRVGAVRELLDHGAQLVVGDLSEVAQTRQVAEQANALGAMDAVIHNAGVYSGPTVMPVNVVAPYLLTACMPRPKRLVYLSSGMHRSGRPNLARVSWAGTRPGNYSDSKLFVTVLAMAVARRWPQVFTNAVDPGWVPTRMGGSSAPDNLRLGHLTQEWLATSDDPRAMTTGGFWHHQHAGQPHPAVYDEDFQRQLIDTLARVTGTALPNDILRSQHRRRLARNSRQPRREP